MEIWIIIVGIIAFALILCFLLAIANFSGEKLAEQLKKLDSEVAETNMTPLEFINFIIGKYIGVPLQIIQISNLGDDAYGKGKLFLSGSTISRGSLASYAIISHELGHAQQDHQGNKLKRFNLLRKIGRILGVFILPSIILGVIFLFFEKYMLVGFILLGFALFIFLVALLIKLILISIEKDASRRAVTFLEEALNESQVKACKKFLKDAKMTYWADFLKTIFGYIGLSKRGKLFK